MEIILGAGKRLPAGEWGRIGFWKIYCRSGELGRWFLEAGRLRGMENPGLGVHDMLGPVKPGAQVVLGLRLQLSPTFPSLNKKVVK